MVSFFMSCSVWFIQFFFLNETDHIGLLISTLNVSSSDCESSPILHTRYCTVLKKSLVKPRNTAENSTGSVRAPSCSNAAMICVSGNDLCHSASNWDLTLLLTHMLFIAVSVIPLYSRRVCVCVCVTTPSCWERNRVLILHSMLS